MFRLILHVAIAAFIIGLSVEAAASIYTVKKGDVLSKIAHRFIPGPVWGRQGSLALLIARNPHIKNPHLIHQGQQIYLIVQASPSSEVAERHEPAVGAPAETSSAAVYMVTQSKAEATPMPAYERGGYLAITPTYALSALAVDDRATGVRSTLATRYNAAADLAYIQQWSSRFRSFLNLSLGSVAFESPTDSSKSLVEHKKILSSIGLGVNIDLGSRVNAELRTAYQQQLFARAQSTQAVTIDAVAAPAYSLKLAVDLIQAQPFVLGVASLLSMKSAAKTDTYEIHSGQQYGAAIYIRQAYGARRWSRFESELSVLQRQQDTTISKQQQMDIALGVRFYFDLNASDASAPAAAIGESHVF